MVTWYRDPLHPTPFEVYENAVAIEVNEGRAPKRPRAHVAQNWREMYAEFRRMYTLKAARPYMPSRHNMIKCVVWIETAAQDVRMQFVAAWRLCAQQLPTLRLRYVLDLDAFVHNDARKPTPPIMHYAPRPARTAFKFYEAAVAVKTPKRPRARVAQNWREMDAEFKRAYEKLARDDRERFLMQRLRWRDEHRDEYEAYEAYNRDFIAWCERKEALARRFVGDDCFLMCNVAGRTADDEKRMSALLGGRDNFVTVVCCLDFAAVPSVSDEIVLQRRSDETVGQFVDRLFKDHVALFRGDL